MVTVKGSWSFPLTNISPSISQDPKKNFPSSLDLGHESVRLLTFATWPLTNRFPVASQFVSAGFYYSGKADIVICFACGGQVSSWQQGMNPTRVHEENFPNCPLVLGTEKENKPFDTEAQADITISNKESSYAAEIDRFVSFLKWPKSKSFPTPSLFASAGFYYSGIGDIVICFSCGGKVSGWIESMIPAQVHKERYPSCSLVKVEEIRNKPFLPTLEMLVKVTDYFKKKDPTATFLSLKSHTSLQSNIRGMTTPNMQQETQSTSNSHKTFNFSSSAASQGPGSLEAPQDVGPAIDLSDMKYEQSRLASLHGWPKPEVVRPEELAHAGFFYIGPEDRVQCAFCRGRLEGWVQGDDPLAEHKRHYEARCRFIQANGQGAGNVPIVRSDEGPDRPRNPDQAIPALREATFRTWPKSDIQSASHLSRAGFYYTGQNDQVKCFYCDGALNDWKPEDDPWIQHAYWFPNCGYVKQNKGQAFIQTVRNNYSSDMSSQRNRRPAVTVYQNSSAPSIQGNSGSLQSTVEGIMSSAPATTVLEMGLTRSDVENAARIWASRHHGRFPDANSLAELAMNIKEGSSNGVTQMTYPTPAETPRASPVSSTAVQSHMSSRPSVSATGTTTSTAQVDENQSSRLSVEPAAENSTTAKSKNQKKREKKKKQKAEAVKSEKKTQQADVGEAVKSEKKNQQAEVSEDQRINEKAEKLMREYNALQEQRLCKVCLDEEIRIVFLPCGHLVCCAMCAPALSKCPICRGTITNFVRTYMS